MKTEADNQQTQEDNHIRGNKLNEGQCDKTRKTVVSRQRVNLEVIITFLCMSETNITRLSYRNIDIDTMLVGSFKILRPETYRSSRQKFNKVQQTLCLDQMNLTITYRTPNLMAEECIAFSTARGSLLWTYYLTDLNNSLKKF